MVENFIKFQNFFVIEFYFQVKKSLRYPIELDLIKVFFIVTEFNKCWKTKLWIDIIFCEDRKISQEFDSISYFLSKDCFSK